MILTCWVLPLTFVKGKCTLLLTSKLRCCWLKTIQLVSILSTRSLSFVTIARPPSSSSFKNTDRSFRNASSDLWHDLPASFRQPRSSSVTTVTPSITSSLFHSRLKTYTPGSIVKRSKDRVTRKINTSNLAGGWSMRCQLPWSLVSYKGLWSRVIARGRGNTVSAAIQLLCSVPTTSWTQVHFTPSIPVVLPRCNFSIVDKECEFYEFVLFS